METRDDFVAVLEHDGIELIIFVLHFVRVGIGGGRLCLQVLRVGKPVASSTPASPAAHSSKAVSAWPAGGSSPGHPR